MVRKTGARCAERGNQGRKCAEMMQEEGVQAGNPGQERAQPSGGGSTANRARCPGFPGPPSHHT